MRKHRVHAVHRTRIVAHVFRLSAFQSDFVRPLHHHATQRIVPQMQHGVVGHVHYNRKQHNRKQNAFYFGCQNGSDVATNSTGVSVMKVFNQRVHSSMPACSEGM